MWNWNALSQQAAQQNAAAAAPEAAAPPQPQRLSTGPLPAAAVARTKPHTTTAAALPRTAASQQTRAHDRRPQQMRSSSANVAVATDTTATTTLSTDAANSTSSSSTSSKPREPVDVEEFSRLRITHRAVSAQDVHVELSERKFIPLHALDAVPRDTFTNDTLDWVTIGVLARKTLSKASANGGSFMVWSLSDLNATELGVFLFGDAYDAHWKQIEGAVVAVLNAALLPATEKNRFAFKVTQPNEVVTLGRAVDFGICKALTSGDARCRLAVNTAKSQYCLHHITARFLQAGKGRQQLNNSMGNFRKHVFSNGSQPKNISAGVYTSAAPVQSAAAAMAAGWHVPGTTAAQKRKRADASGFHGGPMRLAASGAVTQSAPRVATKPAAAAAAPTRASDASAFGTEPKRASRSQRIISSILASSASGAPAPALKKLKAKRVDMMQFMNSGGAPR